MPVQERRLALGLGRGVLVTLVAGVARKDCPGISQLVRLS